MLALILWLSGALHTLPPVVLLPIALPATAVARPGELVTIQAKLSGAHVSSTVRWYSEGGAVSFVPPGQLKDSRTALLYAPLVPGTYKIHAHVAVAGEPAERACCDLVVEGGPPGPTPPVPPGPTPPVPGTLSFWVIVVSDKTAALPDLATMLNASTLRSRLTAGGHTFRWYDQKQSQVSGLGLDKQVQKAGGVPALILLQKGGPNNGRVAALLRVPASAAALLDAIHKAGGK
ncbi:MAG: hypothetical protein ACRESF_08165 [Pseudomonas sp.]